MMIGNINNLKSCIQLRSSSLEERNLENKKYNRKVWESTATHEHKLKWMCACRKTITLRLDIKYRFEDTKTRCAVQDVCHSSLSTVALSCGLEWRHVHLLGIVVGVEMTRSLTSTFAALATQASKAPSEASSEACSNAGGSAS